MARTEITVTVKGSYSYEAPAYGYGYETKYIHTFEDEAGTVYVWKTTKSLYTMKETADGHIIEKDGKAYDPVAINKGSVIRIAATVKGESEYKGQPQTIINRVKVLEVVKAALTKKEWMKKKAEEQLTSVGENEFIWEMPYRQFKARYSDCETVAGSYQEYKDPNGRVIYAPTIKVIIREGRLKNSGVRGKHFYRFQISYTADGQKEMNWFKAVSEENAVKQLLKGVPDAENINIEQIRS